MVSFLAKQQCAIAAMVMLLILLAGLPHPPNPALTQSEPTIIPDPAEGAPVTEVTVRGTET